MGKSGYNRKKNRVYPYSYKRRTRTRPDPTRKTSTRARPGASPGRKQWGGQKAQVGLMASAEREPITGVWGQRPQRGPSQPTPWRRPCARPAVTDRVGYTRGYTRPDIWEDPHTIPWLHSCSVVRSIFYLIRHKGKVFEKCI